jgi:hypothetical protein
MFEIISTCTIYNVGSNGTGSGRVNATYSICAFFLGGYHFLFSAPSRLVRRGVHIRLRAIRNAENVLLIYFILFYLFIHILLID